MKFNRSIQLLATSLLATSTFAAGGGLRRRAETETASPTAAPSVAASTTSAASPTAAPTITPSPSTDAPTAEASSTMFPGTDVPTTESSSTVFPGTDGPTTESSSTTFPGTSAPTTESSTTNSPGTEAPTIESSSTPSPSTEVPTTQSSSTTSPSTDAPSSDSSTDPNIIPTTAGYNFHSALSEEEWDEFPGAGRLKTLDPSTISNSTMGFGYLELYPGGIRELHWHPFSTEWGVITDGECRFTLMDNEGNYENGYAKKGDIWNFPTSYGHSIQAIDEDVGCKMALFFSAPFVPTVNDISLSEMMTAFPRDVLEENLGVSADIIASFYQESVSISPGPMPPPEFPASVSPLKTSPTFATSNGTCINSGDGGYLRMVRDDIFPGATEMSGGYMHLNNGTLRDIHWHPNANEMQYVLNGTLKVGIYSIEGVRAEYTLNAGDVGFVPKGMAHYLEAVDGPADFLLAFDDPYWTTQELSTMLAQVPSYITAASINTTTDIVEEYFPKTQQDFFGDTFVGCPL